ncbi:MAG: hypothetical protein ACFCVD_19125 [Nodosilinea sp.]
MADPFSDDPNSSNGSKASNQGHNGHGDLEAKLPKAPESRGLTPPLVNPQTRQDMRRAFLILLAVGLLIGALTASGVVWVMHRFDLIGVPERQQ